MCTPSIEHWGKLQMLKNFSSNIIFTSSDFNYKKSLKGSKSGGGIFLANFEKNKYEKKITDQFRQVVQTSSGYYAINFVKKEVVNVELVVCYQQFSKEKYKKNNKILRILFEKC